jgi:hypothetical protein
MSLIVRDDTNRYILDYDGTSGQLKVMSFSYSTWDQSRQQYNMVLSDTTYIGGTAGGGGAGTSGSSGSSGTSGINGSSGTSGISGSNGTSGSSGANGFSSNIFLYEAETSVITGNPGSGHILWNNATQIAATQININHLTDVPIIDIDIFLALLNTGQSITIQDRNNSANYQVWLITSTPTLNVGASNYWQVPVSLVSSAGVGTTNFSNNHELFIGIFSPSGTSGSSGNTGTSGTSGSSASNNPLVSNSTLLFLAANT